MEQEEKQDQQICSTSGTRGAETTPGTGTWRGFRGGRLKPTPRFCCVFVSLCDIWLYVT